MVLCLQCLYCYSSDNVSEIYHLIFGSRWCASKSMCIDMHTCAWISVILCESTRAQGICVATLDLMWDHMNGRHGLKAATYKVIK